MTRLYSYRNGSLEWRAVDIAVPTWLRSGEGEHSVQGHVNAWRPILDKGGTLIGAFESEALAGIAIYRPELEEGMADLAVLHVSRAYRRTGVASRLLDEVVRLSRADGARRLYVSATPSNSAVGFYRSRGFEPTDAPNAAVVGSSSLGPDGIHMIRDL